VRFSTPQRLFSTLEGGNETIVIMDNEKINLVDRGSDSERSCSKILHKVGQSSWSRTTILNFVPLFR
jgi:hypothetical protein